MKFFNEKIFFIRNELYPRIRRKLMRKKIKSFHNALHIRLIKGLNSIQEATLQDLTSINYIINLIHRIGLTYDSRGHEMYGKDVFYMLPPLNLKYCKEPQGGIYQIPRQIAEALIYLSKFKITSFIEIGTKFGWTSSFIIAYLRRFNDNIKGLTIDPFKFFFAYNLIKKKIPLKYKNKTSDAFKSKKYDLCFIDGDHQYFYVKNDYENIGKYASICMFHDIDGAPDVKKFWNDLKDNFRKKYIFKEFSYHSDHKDSMGIGIAVKKSSI